MHAQTLRYTALLLALLVLGSSLGIFVDKHFCQEQLKSVAFFSKAKACHSQVAVCPMHSQEGDKNCCDNESKYAKLDLDQEINKVSELSIDMPLFLGVQDPNYNPICNLSTVVLPNDRNKAPPPGRVHSIFTQSFRL